MPGILITALPDKLNSIKSDWVLYLTKAPLCVL
nr:MAG TPA: hypothetical protein [Bacteriophage sp.]